MVTFVDIVFVAYADTVSAMVIISSHTTTESSLTLLKYLLFSQIHVLEF